MVEITALSNERMRAALELLQYKVKAEEAGRHIILSSEDVKEVLVVAGMDGAKDLEVI